MDGSMTDREAKLRALEVEPPGLSARLDRLTAQLSHLEDAGGLLAERLSPVLRPQREGAAPKDPAPADSMLAETLAAMEQRLRRSVDFLEDLAQRVDL